MLVPANHPLRDRMVREIQDAARALNLTLQLFEIAVNDPASKTKIDAAFDAMAREGAQAVFGLQGPHFARERQRIAELSLKHRLPGMFEWEGYAEAGCLLSYGASSVGIWRRAAAYADKILKGAHPSDIPVEQPTAFEVILNQRTARALGLRLPPAFLLRVDRTIE